MLVLTMQSLDPRQCHWELVEVKILGPNPDLNQTLLVWRQTFMHSQVLQVILTHAKP